MKIYEITLKGTILITICCDSFTTNTTSIHFMKEDRLITSIFISDIQEIIEYNNKEKKEIKL